MKTHNCLVWWQIHDKHVWYYTNEGGGHMLSEEFVIDEPPIVCEGVDYIPRHRGWAVGRWTPEPYTPNPKHRKEMS